MQLIIASITDPVKITTKTVLSHISVKKSLHQYATPIIINDIMVNKIPTYLFCGGSGRTGFCGFTSMGIMLRFASVMARGTIVIGYCL